METPTLPSESPDLSKVRSRSVAMPGSLWKTIDDHAEAIDSDRSTYLRELATADLRRLGKLPGSSTNALLAEFAELLSDPQGETIAREVLLKVASDKALVEGGRSS